MLGGRVWLLRSGIDCFAGDLTSEEKELVWATAMAPVADLFNEKVEGVPWRSKPSAYIVAANDQTVHPDLECAAAKRMGATTTRWRAATSRCCPILTSCSTRSATS
jgi:hypothetical protein